MSKSWRTASEANRKRANELQRIRRALDPNRRKENREYERRRRGDPEPTRLEPAVCEICARGPTKGMTALTTDHCHETNSFRGWLCHTCNRAIGMLGDDLAGLMRAVRYLERAACKSE